MQISERTSGSCRQRIRADAFEPALHDEIQPSAKPLDVGLTCSDHSAPRSACECDGLNLCTCQSCGSATVVSRLLVRLEPLLNASDRCLFEEDGACERSRRSSDEDAASNGATLVVLSPKVYTLLTLGEATPMQQTRNL